MARDSPADSMFTSSFPGADELGSCRKTSSSYSKTITGGAEILRVATYKRISSDKASNLPKRDVRFILLK